MRNRNFLVYFYFCRVENTFFGHRKIEYIYSNFYYFYGKTYTDRNFNTFLSIFTIFGVKVSSKEVNFCKN